MKRRHSFATAAILAIALVQLPAASTEAAAPGQLSAQDAGEISTSYSELITNFYKKIEPQTVADSVRQALTAYLGTAGVHVTLAPIIATADAATTARGIDLEVEAAAKRANGKATAHQLAYVAISGIMNAVHDKYTVFLDPKAFAALNEGLDGTDFGGTGIVIQADDTSKLIDVTNVVPNGPADRAGIQQDDVITAIDGVSTKGMALEKASAHLRGVKGTKVSLSIVRDGKPLPAPIDLTRETIHQISVFEKMLPGDIGYVALTVFGRTTGEELATALDRLQKKGAKAIIMDLRENGGGYLDAAVDVSSKFIPSGPIVSVESRASNITTLEANDTAIPPLPLAVLVNGHTASASEITSGAIQDSAVGTIIGTKTFGKGVVQSIYRLPDNSAVKITTARYLTPHNRDINHLGITPDIVIAENKGARFGDPHRDDQLKKALDFINEKIAQLNAANGSPSGT